MNEKIEIAVKQYLTYESGQKLKDKVVFPNDDDRWLSKQEKYEDAVTQFELVTHKESDKNTTARAYHNLGNSLLQAKKYEKSIEAYKMALRNNTKDLDTKYNLAKDTAKKKQRQNKPKSHLLLLKKFPLEMISLGYLKPHSTQNLAENPLQQEKILQIQLLKKPSFRLKTFVQFLAQIQ